MTVSPATEAWERWRSTQRSRRRVISWSSAVGFALVIVGLAIWIGGTRFRVGEQGVSIAVKLGNPNGEDLPLQVSALPDQALQAIVSAQRDTAKTTVEETRSVVEPPAPNPVPAAKTQPKPLAESKSSPAASAPTPQAVNAPQKTPVTEKVIRGVEKGNASELILKPQGEKVSQNAYWPVYLFMPVPSRVSADLLAKIPATTLYSSEERRALLLQFYSRSGAELVLTTKPDLSVRPALWQILESAGYDVSHAEYKQGRTLNAVVIHFQLGLPPGNGGNPPLSSIHLDQSSGDAAVDEAVMYAFQLSTFANGTGQVVQGQYTYDFQGKSGN